MMKYLITSIFLLLTLNFAFAFTPSHQEACCLAMQRQEPLDELRCEGLALTQELCKSIVQNFANAANAQHQMMLPKGSISKDPTDLSLKQEKMVGRGPLFLIIATLIFVAVGVFIFKRIKNNGFASFRRFLTLSLALANAPLIIGLVTFGLSKVLCLVFKNQCSTGTILIPIFIVTGICGVLISGLYLFKSWKNRETSLKKNFFILIFLFLAAISTIFVFKSGIP